jgi:hypothetical protein
MLFWIWVVVWILLLMLWLALLFTLALLVAPPAPLVSIGCTGWIVSLSAIGFGLRPKDEGVEEEIEGAEDVEDKGTGGGMGREGGALLVAFMGSAEEVVGGKDERWVKSGNTWGGVREIGESPS